MPEKQNDSLSNWSADSSFLKEIIRQFHSPVFFQQIFLWMLSVLKSQDYDPVLQRYICLGS